MHHCVWIEERLMHTRYLHHLHLHHHLLLLPPLLLLLLLLLLRRHHHQRIRLNLEYRKLAGMRTEVSLLVSER